MEYNTGYWGLKHKLTRITICSNMSGNYFVTTKKGGKHVFLLLAMPLFSETHRPW